MPALSIDRSAKLATPAVAFLVVVPDRVPPAGLVPMARVMAAVEEITELPKLSCP